MSNNAQLENSAGEEHDAHFPSDLSDEALAPPVLEEVLVERAGEVVAGSASGVPSATLPIIPPHVPHVIKFFNDYWEGVAKEVPFQESGYLLKMNDNHQFVVEERPEVPTVADGQIVKTMMPNDKRAIIRGTKLGSVCVFETEMDGGDEFPGTWHSFGAVVAAGILQVRAVDRPRGWEEMLNSFAQWLGHPNEEGYVNVAFYVDEQYGAWKKYFETNPEVLDIHPATDPAVG